MIGENVKALSVRELVRRRCGSDADAWHLALVQRDIAWDEIRMRYLLDSLLKGYPIGSLLVCQVTGQSRVIQLREGERVVETAELDSWQLLDGQQRINAFFSLFTPDGRCGHFYLHMTAPMDSGSGPVTRRRARDQGLRYIRWQEQPEADHAVPQRDQHLDLSRWYGWAEREPDRAADAARALAAGPEETLRILNEVDPDFADRLEAHATEIAWHRLRRLLEIWLQPAIPVQYLTLGSPEHVLEVFTRLNRAGVQVAGEDLFFAAVKTRWNDAEPLIARVVERLGPSAEDPTRVEPLIDRLGAFRTIARLAARAVGQADLVPLLVDRLSETRGATLINAMQRLSDPDEPPVRRMAATLQAVMRSSGLGFGLYSVDERLWDDVLAWAAINPHVEDPTWLREQLPSIDSYLVGATSFRYPSVLRDRFSRLAMTEALAAGLAKEAFPTQRIAEVTRTLIPDLREGRTRIRGSKTAEERLWLADSNAGLFLSVLQSIPYRPQRNVFDWDHIFPQGQAGLMCSRGSGGRRRHHPHRHLVGSAGNLWGLDAGANRELQDLLPQAKFAKIRAWVEDGKRPVWAEMHWWLKPEEIKDFEEIGSLLELRGDHIEPAMERFHHLVTARARHMTDEVFKRFPAAELFAAGNDRTAIDPIRDELPIAAALGVEITEEAPAEPGSGTPSSFGERVERVLRLADEWGSGPAVRDFVARSLRLHLQARGYQWTVTITPPTTKAIALIAMTPNKQQRGLVKTWVAPAAFTEHFPGIVPERFDEDFGGIRGSLLDSRELEALADRLEKLLPAQPQSVLAPESGESLPPH